MPSSALRDQLARDGFVVIPNLLTPSQLTALRAAASRTTALARVGHWPDVRTVGKQFPPWPAPSPPGTPVEIWGVQGLLNPALPDASLFAESYFGAPMPIAKELLSTDDDDDDDDASCTDAHLVMELYNMLIDPPTPFSLSWHRDDIPAHLPAPEELARLRVGQRRYHTQWNLALYPDASLVVVPGSHRRARSAAEREKGPYDDEMPGQRVVRLGAGDAVFYDNNILHRGVYASGARRASLHGSVGHVGGGALRARNVLQHAVGKWVRECDFSALDGGGDGEGERERDNGLRARAEGMRERLVRMGEESGEVGYSLTG
ncbi:phytanoyl-CoA dioxygenase family protein [Xylariaceae sp. FL0016]|nr:phytanoyl-CoA dioxygenase family protein [Xylariaceae sp. FL0016]